MTSLSDLIVRLGQAASPDRILDAEILRATNPACADRPHKEGWPGMLVWQGDAMWEAPEFTASLDEALTLMPEDWSVLLAWSLNGAVADAHTKPLGDETGTWPAHAKAATPAIALCIAALRAREVSNG